MTGLWVFLVFGVLTGLRIWGYQRYRNYVNTSADRSEYNPYKEYYTVPMTVAEIQSALSIPYTHERYTSTFFCEEGILRFQSKLGTQNVCDYHLQIDDMNSFSIITVTPRIPNFGRYGFVTMKSYMKNKLNAVKLSDQDMRPHS